MAATQTHTHTHHHTKSFCKRNQMLFDICEACVFLFHLTLSSLASCCNRMKAIGDCNCTERQTGDKLQHPNFGGRCVCCHWILLDLIWFPWCRNSICLEGELAVKNGAMCQCVRHERFDFTTETIRNSQADHKLIWSMQRWLLPFESIVLRHIDPPVWIDCKF